MTERSKCAGEDIVHLGPVISEDGSRAAVRHTADHQIQKGVMRPVKDGSPLAADEDCLSLTLRDDGSYDVDELYSAPKTSEKPAMVNSKEFKTGWDRIFGKQTVGVA